MSQKDIDNDINQISFAQQKQQDFDDKDKEPQNQQIDQQQQDFQYPQDQQQQFQQLQQQQNGKSPQQKQKLTSKQNQQQVNLPSTVEANPINTQQQRQYQQSFSGNNAANSKLNIAKQNENEELIKIKKELELGKFILPNEKKRESPTKHTHFQQNNQQPQVPQLNLQNIQSGSQQGSPQKQQIFQVPNQQQQPLISQQQQQSQVQQQQENQNDNNNIFNQQNESEPQTIFVMPKMLCSIHQREISKVCMKQDCQERMFFCFDCAEEFIDHFKKHKPFSSINEFFEFVRRNPYSERKEHLKNLINSSSEIVNQVKVLLNKEKDRIKNECIPELKLWFDDQCDLLQQQLFKQIDEYSDIFEFNSQYMMQYLKEKKLWNEYDSNVPDINAVQNKSLEFTKNLKGFEMYLEDTYRKVFNMNSIELTKQAFNYFEEMQQLFVNQMDNIPRYKANDMIIQNVTKLFDNLQKSESLQFTNFIAKFPICSNCNKELKNQDHKDHENKIKEHQKRMMLLDRALEGDIQSQDLIIQQLQGISDQVSELDRPEDWVQQLGNHLPQLKPAQTPQFANYSSSSSLKFGSKAAKGFISNNNQVYKSQSNTIFKKLNQVEGVDSNFNEMNIKINKKLNYDLMRQRKGKGLKEEDSTNSINQAQMLNSMTEISKYVETSKKENPGKCRGCQRLYCLNCQYTGCYACKIEWDNNFRSNRVMIKDENTLILDDSDYSAGGEHYVVHQRMKRVTAAIILGKNQLFTGKYEWEVILENNDSCHSIGFGICKKDQLINEMDKGWNLKDFKSGDQKSLIIIQASGALQGGLKGQTIKFQNERVSTFKCTLDLEKGKFKILGKNINVEMKLYENNVGYNPVFYSGCCFKSFNSMTVKQYYSFETLPM